jgi:hypothetical protein
LFSHYSGPLRAIHQSKTARRSGGAPAALQNSMLSQPTCM